MRFLFILLLIVSCGKNQETLTVEDQKQEINFDPAISQMEVRGEARNISLSWQAYQTFIIELENFDHSITAADRLILAIEDMKTTIPPPFDKQPLRSRLKVLETHIKSYHALLTHNEYSNVNQQKRFDKVMISLDEFKIQMMDVYRLEKVKEDILKNLKEMELELEETNSQDSL